jgi:hypothetical protein
MEAAMTTTSIPREAELTPGVSKTGRPSKYSVKLGEQICAQLAAGLSLRSVCRGEGMPDERTVRTWVLDDHQGFAALFDRASRIKAAAWGDELVELADAEPERGKDGRLDPAAVNHLRVRLDTRKWVVSRMLPRVYGDKLGVAHEGNVAVSFSVTTNVPPEGDLDQELDPAARAQAIEDVLRKALPDGGPEAAEQEYPLATAFVREQRTSAAKAGDGQDSTNGQDETPEWWNARRGD